MSIVEVARHLIKNPWQERQIAKSEKKILRQATIYDREHGTNCFSVCNAVMNYKRKARAAENFIYTDRLIRLFVDNI